MTECTWEIDSKGSKNSSEIFLRVKPDCSLKVRLIAHPVKIVKVFTDDRKCINLDSEQVGKRLKEKYPDKFGSVSTRYACWCIDRDSNSLKILDMPVSVARIFSTRVEFIGKKISGAVEGCDWKILTNGKKGKDVRYEAVYLEETPLTEEEKQMVKDRKSEENSYFDLMKIFKSCSFEDAEDKLLN